MEPIYQQDFLISDNHVDRFGRLRPSAILYFAQEVAGDHFSLLAMDYDALRKRGLFWAVTRHRVQITRLPVRGETIHVETWPLPTTRVAYPRSMVAYDEKGNELFRSISIWVLMDLQERNMILPAKSGIAVMGTLRGNELAVPASLSPRFLANSTLRRVNFTDLDRNGHMNNTRYMEWIDDLLPSAFHRAHAPKELTVCYLSECREGDDLSVHWDFIENGTLQVDAHRTQGSEDTRVFSAKLLYGSW